jgi:phage tail sheath protein FI
VSEYLAPGVYVEETSFRAPSIEGVGTSTAAFVGPTLTGPMPTTPIGATPELITSFGNFANIYGGYASLSYNKDQSDPINVNYLALSVKAFFDNGGARLYVSRVFTKGGTDGLATAGTKSDTHVSIVARYPGSWLNRQQVSVTLTAVKAQNLDSLPLHALVAQVPDPQGGAGGTTIFFVSDDDGNFTNLADNKPMPSPPPARLYHLTAAVAVPTASGGVSVYEGLGFDAKHSRYLGALLGANPPRRADALENQIAFEVGKTLNAATLFADLFGTWTDPTKPPTATFTLDNGNDGLPPVVADYTAALGTLEALEDIAIVAAPGSSVFSTPAQGAQSALAEQVVDALITHVERPRAYRVAILDTPANYLSSQVEDVRAKIDSSHAALYTPWVVIPNPLWRPGTVIPAELSVPPSGFMAGIYARNDQQRSVAKAPANEVVLDALRFERNINFAEQGLLNPMGINCLRYFPGRGYRVWGARTASSDSEFKYVNVRRYLIYLEHSIDNGSQWAVFENNGPALWQRVRESVEEFLFSELANNNLLGTTPAEAYFVRCDRSTMTQNDLDNGRLICLIGVALLKPAEFVIFRIGQKTATARS